MLWAHPTVLVVTGLPGTGKSTLADRVAEWVGAPSFSGDWLLGAIAPSGALDDLERSVTLGIYEGLLRSLFTRQLMLGQSAILDCTASDRLIEEWAGVAAPLGGRLLTVECVCSDEEVHRSRIEGRTRNIPGWHEIDWSHVEYMRRGAQPMRIPRLIIDALRPLEENVSAILAHSSAV